MESITKIIIIGIIAVAAGGLLLWQQPGTAEPCRNFNEAAVEIGSGEFTVFVAESSEEKARGLGGCEQMPDKAGMYFPYTEPRPAIFWMKDMRMPIDIIWIAGGTVIGIEQNIQAPAADTPDADLTLYRSPQPVDGVLEVSAGAAEAAGIRPGDNIRIEL